MEPLNIESLLAEIDPDQPCGEELDTDSDFLKLEKCSEDWIKQKVHPSQNGVKESDWKSAHKQALALFAKTKDLRVAVHLTQARTIQEGLPGFHDALGLLNGLTGRYWDSLHPQLDPDDDNDPTQRINILESLCHPHSVLDDLRRQPLVDVRGVGRFSFRDVQMARGDVKPQASGEDDEEDTQEVSSLDLIRGAFMETPWEALNQTQLYVLESRERLQELKAFVESRTGPGRNLDFAPLEKLLQEMNGFLQERIDARPESQAQPGNGGNAGSAPAAGRDSVHGMAYSGDIKSREDVVNALDKICDYYDRYEPSSPLPILLRRAKRLVSKNFVEIIQDLSPDGLKQVEQISGEEYTSDD